MANEARGSRLDIRLLGPPEVQVDGVPLTVDTRKAVAILALLATDGRPYARDELAAMLWPESDDASARGALRRTLSTLHAAVGEGPLDVGRERVALVASACRVDLADLERLAGSDASADLTAAADLVRGPFLAGFSLRDSVEFDDWRATRAAAVERTVLGVLDRLTVAREAAGDLPGAIDAAARRLDRDPLDETAHVRLMDLYAATGDRSAALRQYRTCVAVLERELGVAPLSSTTARYEAIRDAPELATRQVPPPDAASWTTAIVPARDAARPLALVARDDVLVVAMEAWARADHGGGALIALVGEAGIGKTAVGDTIAARVASAGGRVLSARAFAGERTIAYGTLVEALRHATDDPAGEACAAMLDPGTRSELGRLYPALDPGHRPPDGGGPAARTRLLAAIADGLTTLAGGPNAGMLWVDDVQWADGATLEAIAFLARRLPGRRLLVVLAWRPEDLDAEGAEFAGRVALMPDATVIELSRLGSADIAAMITDRWGPDAADPVAVERLAAASEGLPLYVVEALAGGPDLSDVSMPHGVRAVLRARIASVGEPAGQVLTTAALIGRSFDVPTLRYASGRSEEETVDAVDELLRRTLIHETAGGYGFVHDGLRELTVEATSLARRRLLHRRIADGLRLDLAGDGRDDLGRLVLIATHERDAGRDLPAAEAFRAAGERAAALFANREAIGHDEAALALGHPDAVGLHAAIGALRTRLGDYDGAIGSFEAAAALATRSELPALELSLARVHVRRGDLVAADRHLDAGLAATDDEGLAARMLVDRAVVRRRAGDIAGAAAAATEARSIATRIGDPTAIGAADRLLGLVALDRGDATEALLDLGRALAAADADPDPTARVAALTGLALAAAATGDLDAAADHGDLAIAECRRVGDRHLEAAVENHLADLYHAAGRDDEAMTHLARAVAAFAEVGGDPADPDPGIWMLSGVLTSGDGAPVEPDPLPEEPLRGGVPREQDDHLEPDRQPGRRCAGPRTLVGAGQCRDLEHALWPHHDLAQVERVVREGGEQVAIERSCTIVTLPDLGGRDDLVHAVRRERRDEPLDVAAVLGDRVADPEALDPAQLARVEPTRQPGPDRAPPTPRGHAARSRSIASRTRSTSAAVL